MIGSRYGYPKFSEECRKSGKRRYEGSMLRIKLHESYRLVAASAVGDDRTAISLH
jgi:hypothetical protein